MPVDRAGRATTPRRARLAHPDATIVTHEMVLFQWLGNLPIVAFKTPRN
jgi:hypothetical protein